MINQASKRGVRGQVGARRHARGRTDGSDALRGYLMLSARPGDATDAASPSRDLPEDIGSSVCASDSRPLRRHRRPCRLAGSHNGEVKSNPRLASLRTRPVPRNRRVGGAGASWSWRLSSTSHPIVRAVSPTGATATTTRRSLRGGRLRDGLPPRPFYGRHRSAAGVDLRFRSLWVPLMPSARPPRRHALRPRLDPITSSFAGLDGDSRRRLDGLAYRACGMRMATVRLLLARCRRNSHPGARSRLPLERRASTRSSTFPAARSSPSNRDGGSSPSWCASRAGSPFLLALDSWGVLHLEQWVAHQTGARSPAERVVTMAAAERLP